jgi:hypothetical protein
MKRAIAWSALTFIALLMKSYKVLALVVYFHTAIVQSVAQVDNMAKNAFLLPILPMKLTTTQIAVKFFQPFTVWESNHNLYFLYIVVELVLLQRYECQHAECKCAERQSAEYSENDKVPKCQIADVIKCRIVKSSML